MPPAAATECERTGWTLLMIATVAPASAAARAARCPARPAPMISTSWEGIGPEPYTRAPTHRPARLADADHHLAASSVRARAPPWHLPCVLARRRRRRASPHAPARGDARRARLSDPRLSGPARG